MTKSVENKYSNDVRLQFSDYLPNNVEKSRPLEIAAKIALQSLSVPCEDLTHVYNGTQTSRHQGLICGFVPDFMTSEYVIECKAWNDTYRVSRIMVNTKIVQRVGRCVDKKPIVIFGKMPRFQRGVKGYLLSRVKLLFVGFAVKWHNLRRAVQVLKMKLSNILKPSMSQCYDRSRCGIVKKTVVENDEPLMEEVFLSCLMLMYRFLTDSGPPYTPYSLINLEFSTDVFTHQNSLLPEFDSNFEFFPSSDRSKPR